MKENQLDKEWEAQLQFNVDYTDRLESVIILMGGKQGTSKYLELTQLLAEHKNRREYMIKELESFEVTTEMDEQNAAVTRDVNKVMELAKEYSQQHEYVLGLWESIKTLRKDRDNKLENSLTKSGETIHKTITRYEGLLELAIQGRTEIAEKLEGSV